MTTPDFRDFNDAGEQKSFDVIPDSTIAMVQLAIRPGNADDGGWLRRSKDGASEMVDCEFTIVDGPFAKRKVFQMFTVSGTTSGHAEASEISNKAFAAILESARGIRPDDKSDTAKKARMVSGWQDFDQLRFVVRIGVRPPQNGYEAKNTIKEVITPERQAWRKPEQIDRSQLARPASNATAAQPASQPTAQPANAIARPTWAK
jgi:hypothetical protein